MKAPEHLAALAARVRRKPPETARAAAPRSKATTRTIWLSLGAVALVGAAASYRQALGVVQAADGRTFVSWCVAGLADPTILAASVNIIDANRQGDRVPRWSVVSIAVAVVVTLGMNVAAGSPHLMPKWLVSVWPPVAFLLALESLMSYLRRGRGAAPVHSAPAAPDHCPHGVTTTRDEAAREAYLHERDCEAENPTLTAVGTRFGLSRKQMAALVTGAPDGKADINHQPSLNGHADGAS
jgi:hypothetical protein